MDERTIARFWSKVDKRGPVPAHCPELGPCWVWVGGQHYQGYGRFCFDTATKGSHVVGFFIAHGRWAHPCTLHRCDNRACCRGSHLFEGTRADNSADMIAKGRDHKARGPRSGARMHPQRRPRGAAHAARSAPKSPAQGERHAAAKLTDNQVRDIIRLSDAGFSTPRIGRRMNVTRQTVWLILVGKTWRHVTGLGG